MDHAQKTIDWSAADLSHQVNEPLDGQVRSLVTLIGIKRVTKPHEPSNRPVLHEGQGKIQVLWGSSRCGLGDAKYYQGNADAPSFSRFLFYTFHKS